MNLGLRDQFREARKLFVTSRQLESDGLTSSLSSASFKLYNLGQLIESLWVLVLHLSNIYQSTLQTRESCSRVRDNHHYDYYYFNPQWIRTVKSKMKQLVWAWGWGLNFWECFLFSVILSPNKCFLFAFTAVLASRSMSRPACRYSKCYLAWNPRWTRGVGGTVDCGVSWGYASSLDRE